MDSVDIEVLRSAEGWRKAGHRVALGTIVKTWGSAPRPVGAMVAVRDDGQVQGSVSGGCVEDDLIDKVQGASSPAGASRSCSPTASPTRKRTRWGLPCGGTLQLVMEPLSDGSGIQELLNRIGSQQLVKRHLEMDSGKATLEAGRWQDVLEFDGSVLSTVHGPRWRLVLIGAGQLTRYLAADGAHARLPRHGDRSARGIRRRLGPARRAARPRHARRRGARAEPRRPHRAWSR